MIEPLGPSSGAQHQLYTRVFTFSAHGLTVVPTKGGGGWNPTEE